MNQHRLWWVYALIATVAWGVWGALLKVPNFPDTLVYVVWSLTMIPPAIVAMSLVGWKLDYDKRSIIVGCAAGLLGAGGQLILFKTVPPAPAYLVFPFIALSPIVTIVLALVISREKAALLGWVGIALAIVAGAMLFMEEPKSKSPIEFAWLLQASLILIAWGAQGFVISYGNKTMKAESIFFYMMLTAILLSPFAIMMTDFTKDINWGFDGPYAAALIHSLNSIGALLLVYAFRYGKAIIVSPLINAGAPALTTVISLLVASEKPYWVNTAGMVVAIIATILMALEEEMDSDSDSDDKDNSTRASADQE